MNKKIVIGVLAIAALFLLYRFLPIQEWLSAAIEGYRGLGAWGAVLFILTYVGLSLLLMPGSALTIAAGVLYGFVQGYLVVAAASLIAVALAFLLAKSLLRSKVESWAKGYPRFQAVNEAISRQGAIVTFLVRLSPAFPFSISNYLFGLTRVHFGWYMLANWLGMAPGTLLYIYIGMVGRELTEGAGGVDTLRMVLLGVGLLATFAVTVLVTRMAKKALAEKTNLRPEGT